MGFHLFRSREKSTSDDENESLSGYDEYGMTVDKQWARKYLLDPLTAPEPCQETWSCLRYTNTLPSQRQEKGQKDRCFSPSSSSLGAGARGVDGGKDHHHQHGDLRDALEKVSKRFLRLKQRCRRSSPASSPSRSGKNVSESGRGSDNNLDQDIANIETGTKTKVDATHRYISNNYRDDDYLNVKHTRTDNHGSCYTRDTRRAVAVSRRGSTCRRGVDPRASWSSSKPSGRIADFDPTNPYYGTSFSTHHQPRSSRSSSSDHRRGHGRHSRTCSSSAAMSSYSRRRSSANTTASSSPPSLYACSSSSSMDLGPYPAHLTLPRPMIQQPMLARRQRNVPSAAAPVSWKAKKCSQLEKARWLRANQDLAR
ncbi:hypothetical protein E4U21_000980 [Claviceps maximensis]|nr:hypothetical protein E4U21_000980 [Claviceps maximensis]